MIAPGFSADCLETLEELDVENREIFLHNGGERFSYIPALNATPGGIDVIEAIVRRELAGWIGNGVRPMPAHPPCIASPHCPL